MHTLLTGIRGEKVTDLRRKVKHTQCVHLFFVFVFFFFLAGEGRGVLGCWLLGCLSSCPSNMLVYLWDGSAHKIVRAATLRWELQIELPISPGHSILTPGQPVPALAL